MESDQSLTDGEMLSNCSRQLNSITRPRYGAYWKMVRLEKENVVEGYDNANPTMTFSI